MLDIKKYPKILIIGETFNLRTGGGITLSNLFADWPKECLFNASGSWQRNEIDCCKSYYQLGNLENKFLLPWFVRKNISGSYLSDRERSGEFTPNFKNIPNKLAEKSRSNFLKHLVHSLFLKLSYFFGIQPILLSQRVSTNFLNWIDEIKPDYIYTQLGNINSIRLIKELSDRTRIPICIHIMDDWPSNYCHKGLFTKYWKNKIDQEFRKLITISKICMSISEGMKIEYLKRYDREFKPFHNPIDINLWLPSLKKDFHIDNNDIKILYAGRIGLGITNALIDIIRVVDDLRKQGYHITLYLQSPATQNRHITKYCKRGTVKFNPYIPYNKIPSTFSNADLLILPYDFDDSGLNFIRYSMPTKASEYMMSGTPILLYCSKFVFLSEYSRKHGWAYTVTNRGKNTLKEGMISLLENETLRKSYSKQALIFALKNFDSRKIRLEFLNSFE